MTATEDIQHLINQYSFTIDSGNLEGFARLFTKGEWCIEGMHTFKGHQEVLAYLENNVIIYEDGTPRTRHLATNVDIHVDESGSSAAAQCYVTVVQQTDNLPLQAIFSGVYVDQLGLDESGWYFKKRTVKSPLFGDMSNHVKPQG